MHLSKIKQIVNNQAELRFFKNKYFVHIVLDDYDDNVLSQIKILYELVQYLKKHNISFEIKSDPQYIGIIIISF